MDNSNPMRHVTRLIGWFQNHSIDNIKMREFLHPDAKVLRIRYDRILMLSHLVLYTISSAWNIMQQNLFQLSVIHKKQNTWSTRCLIFSILKQDLSNDLNQLPETDALPLWTIHSMFQQNECKLAFEKIQRWSMIGFQSNVSLKKNINSEIIPHFVETRGRANLWMCVSDHTHHIK